MEKINELYLISNVLYTKTLDYIYDFYNGNTQEVNRIESNNLKKKIIMPQEHYADLLKKPNHIIDNIYLGNAYNACDTTFLNNNNIKNIINVTREIPNWYPEKYRYLKIPVRDTRDSFLDNYYRECYDFIINSPKKTNIFIHCYMGSSRSASIVVYYIMKRHNKTFTEALEHIKSCRSNININTNFSDEIKFLEKLDYEISEKFRKV